MGLNPLCELGYASEHLDLNIPSSNLEIAAAPPKDCGELRQ